MTVGMTPVQKTWFGHPRGLTILFLTELWEKFSFYGMRALLVYYMIEGMGFTQSNASYVYGIYAAFTYFTPILGGPVVDRYLGYRRGVLLGGSIMALGHFMMAFDPFFYPALATIAIGNGLFLPSLPSQVPTLYAAHDPRRAGAFNLYYVGINIGAFLAPLVCGALAAAYGWHYGFAAAGAGMLCGLVVYALGQRHLVAVAMPRNTDNVPEQSMAEAAIRIWPLLISIFLIVIFFRSAYEQIGNSFAVWSLDRLDRSVGGWGEFPAAWLQSVNPMLVIAITPVFGYLWMRLRVWQGIAPDITKMASGAAISALAFLFLMSVEATASGKPGLWTALVFVGLLTLGEIFILPTGIALFSSLAPHGQRAMCVALWFLAAFAGHLLAGWLGGFWSIWGARDFFAVMAAIMGGVGLLFLILAARVARQPSASPGTSLKDA